LITGDPCDHEWTEERYEEANRQMEAAHPELATIRELAEEHGLSVEELKGALERIILSREPKQ
jgi:hypothetical protein